MISKIANTSFFAFFGFFVLVIAVPVLLWKMGSGIYQWNKNRRENMPLHPVVR